MNKTKAKLYIIQLALGENWDHDKEAHDQIGFSGHVENMKSLREQGKLIIGARYGDLGMLIVRADSLADANAMAQADPMIAAGCFVAEISEFSTFYDGCTASE